MRLLYPRHFFSRHRPDEVYEDEYDAVQQAGLPCALFSYEDLERGTLAGKSVQYQEPILMRSWMMTLPQYRYMDTIHWLYTPPKMYELCHHLPRWYSQVEPFDITSVTYHFSNEEWEKEQDNPVWSSGKNFVKDYVKSVGTKSVTNSHAEVLAAVETIRQQRGFVEGGVCIRAYEEFANEKRLFCVNGTVYSHDGSEIPQIIKGIATRIASPFFSIDIGHNNVTGDVRIIEMGDGQVSDRKEWDIPTFVKLLEKIR